MPLAGNSGPAIPQDFLSQLYSSIDFIRWALAIALAVHIWPVWEHRIDKYRVAVDKKRSGRTASRARIKGLKESAGGLVRISSSMAAGIVCFVK